MAVDGPLGGVVKVQHLWKGLEKKEPDREDSGRRAIQLGQSCYELLVDGLEGI